MRYTYYQSYLSVVRGTYKRKAICVNGRIGNAGGRPFIPAPGVATLAHEEHLSQSLDLLRCVLIATCNGHNTNGCLCDSIYVIAICYHRHTN